jgi:hypothetical protein
MAWVIFLLVAVPLIGVVVYLLLDESFVRVPADSLGLLLVRGVPTNTTLGPGVHWVPALRRRVLVEYPALELAYRAGETWQAADESTDLERGGPALQVMLGDRTVVVAGYTVRFRLDKERLPEIHTRFGPDGIWAAVRDETSRTLRESLGDARLGVDELFGPSRLTMEAELTAAMSEALSSMGLVVTMFSLGDLDLGRAGEVIQATVRARLELAREEAEAAMRIARARIDSELGPFVDMATAEAALRYREVDSWRELSPAWGRPAVPYSGGSTTASTAGSTAGSTTGSTAGSTPTVESTVEDSGGELSEPI